MGKLTPKTKYGIEDLVSKGQDMIDQCQPDLAIKFFEKALKMEPKNSVLLDILGELYIEVDNPDKALAYLTTSIEMEPIQNPTKWFYAAQLMTGNEAEKYYLEGVSLLRKQLKTSSLDENDEENIINKKQLSDAYCSLAELYMTDLCYEVDAEKKCEDYIQEAMGFDVGYPESTQSLANLLLSQKRIDEATEAMIETYQRIINCDESRMPPLEFRIMTGKLLIEVNKHDFAADILELAMQEDDENAELWFLVGMCYKELNELQDALEFFTKCKQLLQVLKKEMGDEEFYLENQLQQVEQYIQEIANQE